MSDIMFGGIDYITANGFPVIIPIFRNDSTAALYRHPNVTTAKHERLIYQAAWLYPITLCF